MGVTTDKLILTYTDCAAENQFHCENINKDLSLGESIVKTFQIKNESKSKITYTLYFKHLQNTFKNDELIYKIENIDTGKALIDTTPVPFREVKTANIAIKESIEIEGKTTQNYRMTVTFLNKDYNQNENLNAKYSIKLSIVPSDQKLTESISNELMRVTSSYNEKIWQHRADIKKIVFEDTLNPKENASYIYDISSAQNESVMSYLVPDAEDETKYIAYIQSEGETVANRDSSLLFYNFTSLETISNLNILNTSKVTSMSYMFSGCSNLTELDLSNFNTSKVTDMNWMFRACNNLTTLDVSTFNTGNVTTMYSMFSGCSSLTTLDLSNFDTSNVTNMGYMFGSCINLKIIKLENFNTHNVVTMSSMFSGCINLEIVNVSNFDTSKVTSLSGIFNRCNKLKVLDVSNFDTSNCTNMYYMFYGCSSLTELDVSHFDTSKVTDMRGTFANCSSLKTLDVSNFDTSNCTNMYDMFYNCSSLTTLNVSNFNTSNVITMYRMFGDCSNLTTLDISNFDTSKVTNMSCMFYGCSGLTTLNLSNFDISNVTDNKSMFFYMSSTINIIIKSQELKPWIIDASGWPKLADANFTTI